MKTAVEQFEVQSTMTGERVRMGIAQDSIQHVLSVLTDLYSNKLRAIIREYSTNAYDAHIEAGVTRPIEVTIPSLMMPFLKIKDYGIGLTAEDIRSIYSQYGASTKRATNDQNGMLGLGCKSALTYCSQFTVTSVKDGMKIIVNVGRDEDGGGSMTVVREPFASDDPNGTEVTIPVVGSDMATIAAEADWFFEVWEPGTVLVNGEAPRRFESLRLTDDLHVVDRLSHIVMGKVAYPAPGLDDLVPGSGILAFVKIGEVNFPPSREALMDTKTTRTTIENLRREVKTQLKGAIQREVDACSSPQEAVRIVIQWSKKLHGRVVQASDFKYKGDTLPALYRTAAYVDGKPDWEQPAEATMKYSAANSYRRGQASNRTSVPVAEWPKIVWVEGYAVQNFTAGHKDKLVKWCEDHGFWTKTIYGQTQNEAKQVDQFVMLTDKAPDSKFIDPKRIAKWEDVKKIKLPRNVNGNGYASNRIPGSYDIITQDGHKLGVPGDDIDQTSPIYHLTGNYYEARQYMELLKSSHPKFTLVYFGVNRVDKWKRNVPKSKDVKEGVQALYDAWVKTLTDDQRRAYTVQSDYYMKRNITNVDPSKLHDPRFAEVKRLMALNVKAISEKVKTFRYIANVAAVELAVPNPLDDYPLATANNYRVSSHTYDYMNWHYKAGVKP